MTSLPWTAGALAGRMIANSVALAALPPARAPAVQDRRSVP